MLGILRSSYAIGDFLFSVHIEKPTSFLKTDILFFAMDIERMLNCSPMRGRTRRLCLKVVGMFEGGSMGTIIRFAVLHMLKIWVLGCCFHHYLSCDF